MSETHPTPEKPAWVPTVGDIVYLRSGSQPMTVVQILREGMVDVAWIECSSLRRDTFPIAALDTNRRETP
jgi:uncharacterized protein YodC (DUF2158 family)